MNTKQFLDSNSQEVALRSAIFDFDSYEPEVKEEIKMLWTRAKEGWARTKLVNVYGMSDDSNTNDSNSRLSER